MWALAAALFLLFTPAADYQAEGLKALEAKQYTQAVQLFSQAIAADPKDYAAHFQLALAYSLLNKDAEAIPEYKKALDLKPGLYQAELNLGLLLVRQKQPAEAVPYLDAIATNDSGQTSLFILNRDLSKARTVDVIWEDQPPNRVLASQILTGSDLKAVNGFDAPERVKPQAFDKPTTSNGRTRFEVPARSYTVIQWGA